MSRLTLTLEFNAGNHKIVDELFELVNKFKDYKEPFYLVELGNSHYDTLEYLKNKRNEK